MDVNRIHPLDVASAEKRGMLFGGDNTNIYMVNQDSVNIESTQLLRTKIII